MIQFFALFLAKHLDDVTRRHSAQRIKPFLGKIQSVPGRHRSPGLPVEWHGVCQCSVAIENDPTYLAHSCAQFSPTPRKSNKASGKKRPIANYSSQLPILNSMSTYFFLSNP